MATIGVLIVSLHVNQRSIDRERAARLAVDRVLCQVFAPLDDGYRTTPPSTASGRTFAAGIAAARRLVCH